MTVSLPASKRPPTLAAETMKVLVYGHPKVGKSTFANGLDDNVLFLATEPGLGGLEVFEHPTTSWTDFREVGAELAKGEHHFKVVAIDTADALYKLCVDHLMTELGISHPGDLEYGKGWGMVNDEFELRVGKLSSLGLGVVFISHAKEVEIKQSVGTITRIVPTLSAGPRRFITSFVDYIFYAEVKQTPDGERRLLRTAPGENFEAGGRTPLPLADPLPLDAVAVRAEMVRASGQVEAAKPKRRKTAKAKDEAESAPKASEPKTGQEALVPA